MALYFMQQPQKYHPAYNEIIFVTSGTNNTQTNYQYILDVWLYGSSSLSKRFKVPPRPDGYGVFDVSEFVRQYITQDIALQSPDTFSQNMESYVSYNIRLGEEYGTSGTVYANIETSGTYHAWNGVLDPLDYVDYIQQDYLIYDTASKFLTNSPNTTSAAAKKVKTTENEWLYFITSGTNQAAKAVVSYYNGSNFGFTVINPYSTVTIGDQMFLRFGVGYNQLSADFTGTVQTYNVYIADSSNVRKSEIRYYEVHNYCTIHDNYRLHFLNKLGGFDSFTFTAVSKDSLTIDRQKYKKVWGSMSGSNYTFTKGELQESTFSTIIKDKLLINSDWITEAQSYWLEELVTSPIVYWETNSTLIPINITNTSYDKKKVENEKMFNLIIEAEFTYNRYRQG